MQFRTIHGSLSESPNQFTNTNTTQPSVPSNGLQSLHYCAPCKRSFKSAGNLDAHLRSATHQPKVVACSCKGCESRFVSLAAVILHIETGICSSGVTRADVNKFVRLYNANHKSVIDMLIPRRDIVTEGRAVVEPVTNGNTQLRYQCSICRAKFRSNTAATSHVESPKHEAKLYKCPNEQNGCHQTFSALSGVFQHIESGAGKCQAKQMKGIQKHMGQLMRYIGRKTR